MQRVVNCNRCKKDFIQKWVNREGHWSQLNQVSYWTDGKKWKDYDLFCRSCIKAWFEFEREIFNSLVSENKKKLFFSYRGHGALDKPDYYLNK